mgnify:CR=1 FL=1
MKTPGIAIACWAIGVLALLVGGFLAALAILSPRDPDTMSVVITGFSLLFSSVIWFVFATALTLLARIEYNTRTSRP